jgi:Flp pilus assembly protein TadG
VRRAQRAQALVWLAVAVPMFLAIAGLAIDGALLLTARRQLQSVADGAARAGATQLNQELLRGSGGSTVELDPPTAHAATLRYLQQYLGRDLPWTAQPETSVQVTRQRVQVAVQGGLRTAFLRLVDIDHVIVGATANADVQYGIRGPGGR